MKSFTQKYNEFEEQIKLRLQKLVKSKGRESKHTNDRVLLIKKDEIQFNFERGRYLTEISETNLIDNYGYSYYYSALTLAQLCEIIDSFK